MIVNVLNICVAVYNNLQKKDFKTDVQWNATSMWMLVCTTNSLSSVLVVVLYSRYMQACCTITSHSSKMLVWLHGYLTWYVIEMVTSYYAGNIGLITLLKKYDIP